MLLIKRGEIIDKLTKSNINSRGEKFFDTPKKVLKITPEQTKKSFFEPIEVSKAKRDSIKLKIFRDKNLSTTIDKERYTLSNVIDLVNKIDSKSIGMDEAINSYNDIAKKGEKNAKLRQTRNRQKLLEIINSFKKNLMKN